MSGITSINELPRSNMLNNNVHQDYCRTLYTFTVLLNTQKHQFFIGVLRVRERGRGRAEKSPKSPNGPRISDVKEEGATVERGRENRLARLGQPRVALTTPSRASEHG